jgi:hypothetical protein
MFLRVPGPADLLATAVVELKKAGGGFSAITPTMTLRGVFVDILLSASDTNTLGIADLVFTVTGFLAAAVRLDVVTLPTEITAIKAKTDLLPADPASQAAVIAAIPTADAIRDAVLNDLLANHTVVGSIADGVAVACGLLQGNFYMDNVNNADPNGQTSARLRLWRTAAEMVGVTAGGAGEGEFATFLVATTYAGLGKIVTHQVVRQ